MKILCRIGRHKALPSNVWNDGHFFSACERCGEQLIRVPSGRWTVVPRNMRVVWRPRSDQDIVWPGHML